ncbi:hypothetical protein PAPYR_4849 [Paratrimastix pyriformis]|uniref:Uncharacterized protein n=1 Tax=Paratrimastix pyriformis TaxID=342808 RepID=A0ABQ8UJ88_9EUKA|nr:hypothetical protein PAPYR_4849 [Paratrimastix pyriformis]
MRARALELVTMPPPPACLPGDATPLGDELAAARAALPGDATPLRGDDGDELAAARAALPGDATPLRVDDGEAPVPLPGNATPPRHEGSTVSRG